LNARPLQPEVVRLAVVRLRLQLRLWVMRTRLPALLSFLLLLVPILLRLQLRLLLMRMLLWLLLTCHWSPVQHRLQQHRLQCRSTW
jgi:hypothetical protein